MQFKQTHGFLHDLLVDVRAGRAVPAPFQRPYVWGREDVEALWTSILRGYPVGSLLLWLPKPGSGVDVSARGRIGPVTFDAGSNPLVIVDGQNRLATLAWSGWSPDDPEPEGLSAREREVWCSGHRLVADPDLGRVLFVPDSEAGLGARMPASLLLRESELWPAIRRRDREGRPLSDAALDFLVDHGARRVQEARLTLTSLLDATPAEALDAFRHVCRTGVPISDEDLEAALSWAPPAGPGPVP